MRVTVGVIAGLALAVATVTAQPPAQRERAAVLKPPQVLQPDQLPPVARGVAEEFPPSSFPSTPVTRSKGAGMPASSGPAWLTGTDPNVLPAAGLGTKTSTVRQLTPPSGIQSKDDALQQPKVMDRLKGTTVGGKAPQAQPVMQPEQPTAATAFRGTGTNGAPVFAGPPAYRWYGWGSVTPGANPLAPSGQYPKASANWYSITGATPGAFPVPVTNTPQPAPGMDPPAYGIARTVAPQPVVPVVMQPQPQPQVQPQPSGPTTAQPEPRLPESKFMPGSVGGPVSVPTITPPPAPRHVAVTPEPQPPAPPVFPKPEPVVVLPPPPGIPAIPSVEPSKVALPTIDPKPVNTEPKPLPTSVTSDPPREDNQWKPAVEPTTPQPGTWSPANGTEPKPLPTQPVQPSSWQSGSAKGQVVARGQMADEKADPVATLIKQMCQGRADGVEVRFTGTKKIQVCFEIRGAAEAQKLVNDISKRPELTAYQIDFCVLVK